MGNRRGRVGEVYIPPGSLPERYSEDVSLSGVSLLPLHCHARPEPLMEHQCAFTGYIARIKYTPTTP